MRGVDVCLSSCADPFVLPASVQILRLRDLMRRGIAVHHAGLLPIMKETVEMLFCQGYIKVGCSCCCGGTRGWVAPPAAPVALLLQCWR